MFLGMRYSRISPRKAWDPSNGVPVREVWVNDRSKMSAHILLASGENVNRNDVGQDDGNPNSGSPFGDLRFGDGDMELRTI